MEQKKALRRYAKRRHGAYPEVDKFILVDLAGKTEQRYLVDGELFACNLTQAREMMAERLKLSDPVITAATDTYYTPATGWKQPNYKSHKRTDEGSNMNATAQESLDIGQKGQLPLTAPEGQAELAGTEVPFGKWAQAIERQQEWLKNNPEPNKADDPKAWHAWVTKRSGVNRAVTLSRGHALGQFKIWNTGTAKQKPATKTKTNKTKEQTMKKETTTIQTPTRQQIIDEAQSRQQIIDEAQSRQQKPVMIETGSVKITVYGPEQMDTAIASLKKHGVI